MGNIIESQAQTHTQDQVQEQSQEQVQSQKQVQALAQLDTLSGGRKKHKKTTRRTNRRQEYSKLRLDYLLHLDRKKRDLICNNYSNSIETLKQSYNYFFIKDIKDDIKKVNKDDYPKIYFIYKELLDRNDKLKIKIRRKKRRTKNTQT